MTPAAYGKTRVSTGYPWGLMRRAGTRLLCSDGKVRAVVYLAQTPDTFFSTPAAVRIRGHYVRGYMTTEEQVWTKERPEPLLRAYVFRQLNGQGIGLLPPWPVGSASPEIFNALIASAHENP